MILVHRPRGEPVFINADLIETVEGHADTYLGLADGRSMVVSESPEEIVAAITSYRGAVLAAAEQLRMSSEVPSSVGEQLRLRLHDVEVGEY